MSNGEPNFVGDLEATSQKTNYVSPNGQPHAATAHSSRLRSSDPKADLNNEKVHPLSSSSSETLSDYTQGHEKEKTFCPVSDDALIPLPRVPRGQPAPPRQKAPACVRFLLWYNTYRKFYTLVVCLNFVGWVTTLTGHFTYPLRYPGAMVLGNFLAAVLVRNEVFGRILYAIVNNCFAKWPPLAFRLACTSVLQHLGGIHSGCATSGFIWLVINVVDDLRNRKVYHAPVIAMGIITCILIAVAMTAAFPWVREAHHNVFERHHRFYGWSGLVFTWAFTIFSNIYDSNGNVNVWLLIRSQPFWFAFGMTVFISLPWFFVRKVPIDIEIPSPKVAVLRFERGMQQGLLGRISRSAIWEYHAFGIISEGKHAKYHYMICGVQGDFTRALVNDMPTHIWTRELKFAGVSNTSRIYKRGIRFCTGTGLGAALSTCLQSPDWFLIWIGSEQEKTFGPTISGLINRHLGPERVLLWDSKARGGRPNSMKIIKEVWDYWKAEVVFITSNYQGNQEVMEGCKQSGIHAFGTLWDF